MATENGPNLDYAREQVRALMDDRCTVVRPRTLSEEDVASAIRVWPPNGETDGPCLVGERTAGGAQTYRESVDEYRHEDRAILPWDAVGIQEGDVLEVVSSRRDPELAGTRYVITKVSRKTMLVSRGLQLVRWTPGNRWPPEVTPWP